MDPGLDYYSVYGKLRRTDDDDGGGGGGVTGLSSVCGLHHPAGTLGGAAPPSELSDHRTLYFILFYFQLEKLRRYFYCCSWLRLLGNVWTVRG